LTPIVDLLFVYGTLRSAFNNEYARLLRTKGQYLGPRTVRGSVYRVHHYPAFKSEPGGEVRGELYRLLDPVGIFHALDEYEGDDFERILIDAPERAWIYSYKKNTVAGSRIESGDFCG